MDFWNDWKREKNHVRSFQNFIEREIPLITKRTWFESNSCKLDTSKLQTWEHLHDPDNKRNASRLTMLKSKTDIEIQRFCALQFTLRKRHRNLGFQWSVEILTHLLVIISLLGLRPPAGLPALGGLLARPPLGRPPLGRPPLGGPPLGRPAAASPPPALRCHGVQRWLSCGGEIPCQWTIRNQNRSPEIQWDLYVFRSCKITYNQINLY